MRLSHTAAPLLVLVMAGCAPGNPGLYIGNVIAANDQCEYDSGNAALLQGTLDVSVPGNVYSAGLVFNNQLLNLAQSGSSGYPVMANPNIIQVTSVEVELQDIGGAPIALSGGNPFSSPAGAISVPSGDGATAGTAIGAVILIPAAYVPDLPASGTIVAVVRAIGVTLGGAEVVSPEFGFPINLCSGCLVGCAVDADGAPICSPSCTPGQDTAHLECVSATDLTPTITASCRVGG